MSNFKYEKIINIIIKLGTDSHTEQHRQANLILSSWYPSPYPGYSSNRASGQVISPAFISGQICSVQKRISEIDDWEENAISFFLSLFQAHSLSAPCSVGWNWMRVRASISGPKLCWHDLDSLLKREAIASILFFSMKLDFLLIKIKMTKTSCRMLLFPPHWMKHAT